VRRREFREAVVDVLARAWPIEDPDSEDFDERHGPGPDAATPVHALVVVDWQGSDGERWMSHHCMLGNGDDAPVWIAVMLAREVIDWDEGDE